MEGDFQKTKTKKKTVFTEERGRRETKTRGKKKERPIFSEENKTPRRMNRSDEISGDICEKQEKKQFVAVVKKILVSQTSHHLSFPFSERKFNYSISLSISSSASGVAEGEGEDDMVNPMSSLKARVCE